jgi:DNA processing protein
MSANIACADCARRSSLVACLGARMEVRRYDPERIAAALALPDEELMRALGVRDRADVDARLAHARIDETAQRPGEGVRAHAICRHDRSWPLRGKHSRGWGAPTALHVTGRLELLSAVRKREVTAIVGARRASDYGREVARAFAFELSSAGLTVLSDFSEGIGAAALAGALEARGAPIAVMAGGVDVCSPTTQRALYAQVVERGCAISELPCGMRPRRWCYPARSRLIAGVSSAVVVVEAADRPSDLSLARFARKLGRKVAAVPGRITSPVSEGTHALIAQGAPLARSSQDVVEALAWPAATSARDRGARAREAAGRRQAGLTTGQDPRLRALLDEVRAGADTPERLRARGYGAQQVLAGLAKLELAGALVRGDGGRYVPRLGARSAS